MTPPDTQILVCALSKDAGIWTPNATILAEAWWKKDAVVKQNINPSQTQNNEKISFLCESNKYKLAIEEVSEIRLWTRILFI